MRALAPRLFRRWRAHADLLTAALFVAAHGVLLLAWPAIPAQDAPMWIAEGALLRAALHGTAATGCQLVSAVPPNAMAQGVISALVGVVSPDLAGRLYMLACVALFAGGLIYLAGARAGGGRHLAVLAVLPLCVGYPLFHGFLNYLAALPALCWGTGVLLRHPDARGVRSTAVLLVMPVLTYLCHGTALGIWAVLVATRVWIRPSRDLAVRAFLGFVPVGVLLAAYVGQRQAEGAGVIWLAGGLLDTIVYRLRSPLRFFSVFPGFAPTLADPVLGRLAPLLMAVNVTYAVAITACGLHWAWRSRRAVDPEVRWLASSLLALAGLFVVMPHDVAGMLNPAERLLLPAVGLGVAGLAATGPSGARAGAGRERRWRSALYGLLVAQWACIAVWGTQAARLSHAFLQARDRYGAAAAGQIVLADDVRMPASEDGDRRLRAVDLMTRHQVLWHQDLLDDWHHGKTIGTPVTGLFRCGPPPQPPADVAAVRAIGRPLLLIGEPDRAAALARALAPQYRVLRPGPGFWVVAPAQP